MELNKTIMKKILIVGLILIGIESFGQGVNLPQTSDKWITQPNPQQLRQMDIQRNQNIVILMVNENQIRNFNQWRLWRRLKENKRERIVKRWQKEQEKNNTKPEFSKRGRR